MEPGASGEGASDAPNIREWLCVNLGNNGSTAVAGPDAEIVRGRNRDPVTPVVEMGYMASWLVKAIAQRSIGALPNPHYWNELLQERVAHSLELTDERFDCSLRNCRNHLEQFRRYGSTA